MRLCPSAPIVSRGTRDAMQLISIVYGLPMGRIIDQMADRTLRDPKFTLTTKRKTKE